MEERSHEQSQQEFDAAAWAAAKKQEREMLYTKVDELVDEALSDVNALNAYLSVQGRLGKASMINSLLAAENHPDASNLKSFDDWKRYGRSIKKGEEGIKILAPTGEYMRSDGSKRMNFGVKRVFDVAQTRGKNEWKRFAPSIRSALKAVTAKTTVPIRFDDGVSKSIGALYSNDGNSILVARDMDNNDLFFCVTRELARADGCDNTFLCDCIANITCYRYGIEPKLPDAVPPEFAELGNKDKRDALSIIHDTACDMMERIDRNLQAERSKNEPER